MDRTGRETLLSRALKQEEDNKYQETEMAILQNSRRNQAMRV